MCEGDLEPATIRSNVEWFKISSTCIGDLGRGGPGETGRSMWLELASGLSGGLSESGGVGVLASRSGPESLRDKTETTQSHGVSI